MAAAARCQYPPSRCVAGIHFKERYLGVRSCYCAIVSPLQNDQMLCIPSSYLATSVRAVYYLRSTFQVYVAIAGAV